jgi:hypothetical protein
VSRSIESQAGGRERGWQLRDAFSRPSGVSNVGATRLPAGATRGLHVATACLAGQAGDNRRSKIGSPEIIEAMQLALVCKAGRDAALGPRRPWR